MDTKIRISTESWPWRRIFSWCSCPEPNIQPFSHRSVTLLPSYRCSCHDLVNSAWPVSQTENAAWNDVKKTTTKMCTLDDNPAHGDTFLMLVICLAVCAVRLTMTTTSSTRNNLSWKTLSWFSPRRVNWSGSLAVESKYQPDKDHGDLLVLVKVVCV